MIPIYELVMEEDNGGVDLISFVQSPAMKTNWVAFSEEQPVMFNIQSEEKRIVSGAIILADFPVIRMSEDGKPYYVMLKEDTIAKTVQKFFKNSWHIGTNANHDKSSISNGAYMFESYIINRERGINPPEGFDFAKDGSWFGSYKVESDEMWAKVKSGEFNGFSIEGYYNLKQIEFKEEKTTDEQLLESLRALEAVVSKIS